MIKTFIFLNGLYDICCSISILITDNYLSKLHLDLFINKPDEITKRFLSFWIMTYGIIRTSIGFYPKSYELKNLGIISYLVEAFCFEYESFVSNNLHKNKIRFISLFICLTLTFIVYNAILDK